MTIVRAGLWALMDAVSGDLTYLDCEEGEGGMWPAC